MVDLSTSSKSVWLECRLRWYYQQTGEPVRRNISSHLLRGGAGHVAVEQFYAAEPGQRSADLLTVNFVQALEELYAAAEAEAPLASWEADEFVKASTQGKASLQQYWRRYGQDEAVPAMRVEVRLEADFGDHKLHGILDGISVEATKLVIWEHKFPYSWPQEAQYRYWSAQDRDYGLLLQANRLALGLPDLPIYVRHTVLTQRRAEKLPDVLLGTAALAEAQRVNAQVAREVGEGAVYPNYARHCLGCPYKNLCLVRLTGGDNGGSNDVAV